MSYSLIHTKTHNHVYVSESWITIRRKDGSRERKMSPVVAMCGYGPRGKSSRWYRYRSLDRIKEDVKILLKYPKRRKDLEHLRIEKIDKDYAVKKTHSIKRVIKEMEQQLVIDKLRG